MSGRGPYAFDDPPPGATAVRLAFAARSTTGISALVWVFAGTLFLSAALLFILEPMFVKMVLPYLGGSPAVWNTCVVFFQATVLAGYAYAHVLTSRLSVRRQVIVHVALAAMVLAVLPIAVPAGWAPPVDRTPVPALLLLLLVTVGAPLFVVSSSAPLLQRWFSHTRDRAASDPYFLYSASNLGSITALLAYPCVVEPAWSLTRQGAAWSVAFGAFVLATLTCALVTIRSGSRGAFGAAAPAVQDARSRETSGVGWRRRLHWLALALVPSSLMLGVTSFLSTDVAAIPLLWVAPLALYLLSFVIGFSSKSVVNQRFIARLATVAVMPVVLTVATGVELMASVEIPLHLAAFFALAVLLHGRLAHDRPGPQMLTTFYLWISAGGLLGGVFNALVAPIVFTGVAEYPLMLLAGCAVRPFLQQERTSRHTYRDVLIPVTLGAVLAAMLAAIEAHIIGPTFLPVGFGIIGALYAAAARSRVRLTAGVGLMLLAGMLFDPSDGDIVHVERTFFGVLRVRVDGSGLRHTLQHGSTVHGQQALDPATRRHPLTYYHQDGPIGQVITSLSERLRNGHVGVVGLGAGSLAAYARPGQRWTFYEIDPAVERIASSPRFFTYLHDCGAACTVTLGDARLSLTRSTARFDLLILDAFSSDAIPVHLLTREALQIYLAHLPGDGVIAFHISNRHLDLRPVLGALAADLNLTAVSRVDRVKESGTGRLSSSWLVMAREPRTLDGLRADSRWVHPQIGTDVWTDDFSNVVKALIAGT